MNVSLIEAGGMYPCKISKDIFWKYEDTSIT